MTNKVTQNVVSDVCEIVSYRINGLSNKLITILKKLKSDSEKFKELGITFEEKAFCLDISESLKKPSQRGQKGRFYRKESVSEDLRTSCHCLA